MVGLAAATLALAVGLTQGLGVLPGISRSGSTILSSNVNVASDWLTSQGSAYTLQTFIHEIGHALGLPDVYSEEWEATVDERAEKQCAPLRDDPWLLGYFLANEPRVPEAIRTEMSRWGLARDEFVDNGNWPHQIYVREARRMVGEYVMTEHDCLVTRDTPRSVGMGSYTADSHNVQRYVTAEGFVQNEGDVGVHLPGPYRRAP